MALSVGFRVSVSLPPATRVTGLRLLPRWDCLPLSVPAFPGRTGLLRVVGSGNGAVGRRSSLAGALRFL